MDAPLENVFDIKLCIATSVISNHTVGENEKMAYTLNCRVKIKDTICARVGATELYACDSQV